MPLTGKAKGSGEVTSRLRLGSKKMTFGASLAGPPASGPALFLGGRVGWPGLTVVETARP